jgi:MFS family permease
MLPQFQAKRHPRKVKHTGNPRFGMSRTELRAATSLAGIYALRMLGLFMILPVFALYAEHLEGVTPALTGLAIGAYGITQALLQIPSGLLSDRIGRKPVIIGGLLIFALGSAVAAMADTIYLVIIGRALQGAGAIAAAVMALTADLTREEHRIKAMAMIGMSIGLSFGAAMVLGPVLNHLIGVPGIFWATAVMALGGVLIVRFLVPRPVSSRLHRDAEAVPAQFANVLRDGQLLRLDFGILALHTVLTGTFVVLPLSLRDEAGLASSHHWELYLPVMFLSVLIMIPFIIQAERHNRIRAVFLGAVLVLGLAELGLFAMSGNLRNIAVLLVIVFAAFNLLEATLPSLIAKMAPPDCRGTAMGFYSSSQFLGAFLGGAMGGWLQGRFGLHSVYLFGAGAALLWLMVASTMARPQHLSSYLLQVGGMSAFQAQRLAERFRQVRGVADAVVIPDDGVAYLKVDRSTLDEDALDRMITVPTTD